MDDKKKVLIVEGSRLYATVLKRELEQAANFSVDWITTAAEMVHNMQTMTTDYQLAIFEPELFGQKGGANFGKVLDFFASHQIPTLLFSNLNEADLHVWVLQEKAIDYILKENSICMDQIVAMAHRLVANGSIGALVIDHNLLRRRMISRLLERQQLIVHHAQNREQAIHALLHHPEIKLAVCPEDLSDPERSTIATIAAIREHRSRSDLGILGLSARLDSHTAARFIKNGADDFTTWPTSSEEMLFRVSYVLDTIDHVQNLQAGLVRDPTTGLLSKQYIEESGVKLLASDKRGQITLSIAMISIDGFAQIVQENTPSTAHLIFRKVASIILDFFRQTDIIGHYDRAQICALLVDMDPAYAQDFFERLRQSVQDEEVAIRGRRLPITLSMGVMHRPLDSLHETYLAATHLMRSVQKQGGNAVKITF